MAAGPIVVLHDHLDGGVRPATVVDLAHRAGVALPTDDVDELAAWLTITPATGLVDAFSRFDLVGSVLQNPAALSRAAREAVEDLAADGVVYAELRFAPLLHTLGGLTPTQVLNTVEHALDEAAHHTGTDARIIVCAMRDQPETVSMEVMRLAASATDSRVVGVDLAGIEVGHPAGDHARAFALAKEAGLGITIHAGEMDGPHQVASAIETCAPNRIGHGWRLIDDCSVAEGRITALGPTAARVRDEGIPLEICLTSNACLGMPVADHPVRLLRDAGFRVTLSPDDRAITTTSASRELALAAQHHDFAPADLASCNERAAVASFLPDRDRESLVSRVHEGWDAKPARLVHLAERERLFADDSEVYVPAAYGQDGFVHLSGLQQILTPANRFYRGRTDLVALVLDTDALGDDLVFEAGTGTLERFPHLYGPIPRSAVRATAEFAPGADGSFLLPPELIAVVGADNG